MLQRVVSTIGLGAIAVSLAYMVVCIVHCHTYDHNDATAVVQASPLSGLTGVGCHSPGLPSNHHTMPIDVETLRELNNFAPLLLTGMAVWATFVQCHTLLPHRRLAVMYAPDDPPPRV